MTDTTAGIDSTRQRTVDAALVGLFAALPLGNSLTLYVGFPITISHAFAAVLAVVGLVPLLLKRRIKTFLPLVAFGLFLAVYLVSFLVNLGRDLGDLPLATGRHSPDVRSLTKILWLSGSVAIAVVIANMVDSSHRLRLAVGGLLLGAAISGLYGIYQVLGYSYGLYMPLLPGTDFIPGTASFWVVPRATGAFLEPSFFGAFLAASVPFAVLAVAIVHGWVWRRWHAFIGLLMIVGGEVVTFSIGGWIPAAVGVAALAVLANQELRPRVLKTAGAAAAIVALLLVVALPNALVAVGTLVGKGSLAVEIVLPAPTDAPASPSSGGSPEPSATPNEPPEFGAKSANERVATTRAAIEMFLDNPLVGVGPGNFPFLYGAYRPDGTELPRDVLIANNVYAELLAESGALGLLSFLFGSVSMAYFAFVRIRAPGTDVEARDARLVMLGGLAALGAMAANFLTGPSFTILYQWALLGLLAGAISMVPTASPLRVGGWAGKEAEPRATLKQL